MKNQIAVVTGGAGFIGSHMVDLLLDNEFEVRVIDNLCGGHERNIAHRANDPKLIFENSDICNLEPEDSIFKGAKYVFHFAGIGDIVPSIEHPINYMLTNVQGTVRILEACRSSGVKKLIYAASSSCYGLAKTPTKEDHKISPQYPYALSKYMGEQTVFHWGNVYSLKVNSIRIFNAYGTRVRTQGAYGAVFGVFFKQKLSGKPFTVVGDGNQTRDFIYVTDITKAFLAAANSDRTGQVYNLGTGEPQSINRLVELLGGEIVYIPDRPGEPKCTWADISKIKNELDWNPKISFEEGVKKMQVEISEWKDAPLWEPESIEKVTKIWFKYLKK